MDKANLSFIVNGKSDVLSGPAGLLLFQNNFNPDCLRTNDVLRKEDWLLLDREVIQISRERLIAIGDLFSRGLTWNLPNALGHTVVQWQRETDINPAEVTMSGLAPGQNDRITYDLVSMPIPIVFKDFEINARALAASRNSGTPLDTSMAAKAARMVAEKNEDILFNGVSNLTVNGGQVYGYRNFPDRVTGNLTYDWGNAATTGENIVDDILAMITAMIAVHMYGPYVLYVPYAAWIHFQDDHKTNSDKSILTRVKEIAEISDIRPTHALPSGANNQVLLIQMTSDVIQLIDGMQPTTLSWQENAGMTFKFKVMSILVPKIKSDAAGQCGVGHFSKP